MLVRQELLDGHTVESRVAQMAIPVGGRKAEEPAEETGICAEVVARPELLQCRQRLQEHDALAVRWGGEDLAPPGPQRDRLAHLRPMGQQVVGAHGRAELLKARHELFPDLASVKRRRAAVGDPFQRARERRLAKHVALAQRAAIRHQDLAHPGVGGDSARVAGYGTGQRSRHARPVRRQPRRGLHERLPRHRCADLVHRLPRGDGARHGHRVGPVEGHLRPALDGGGDRPRCRPAPVDRPNATLGRFEQGDHIAAGRAHMRIGHRQCGGGRDRGIDRVAAVAKRGGRDLGRLRVRRSDRVAGAMGCECRLGRLRNGSDDSPVVSVPRARSRLQQELRRSAHSLPRGEAKSPAGPLATAARAGPAIAGTRV